MQPSPNPTLRRNERIVRCSAGHLYRSMWVPLISFKAVRLFGRRYQHCPVGRHWSMTDPVDVATLTMAQFADAYENHDSGIW
jgi:hypothetical protein